LLDAKIPLVVPQNVKVQAESSSSLKVSWSSQDAIVNEYIVSYRRTGDSTNQMIKRKVSGDDTSYTISNLRADSSYIIVLTAFAEGSQRKSSDVFTCKTLGNAPGAPNRLAFQVTSPTSLHVSWGEPAEINGKIIGYEVKYQPSEEDGPATDLPPTVVKIPNGNYRSLLVENLMENTTYLYSVRAENESGYGPWQLAKMRIDHQIGTRPPSAIFLDEQSIKSFQEQQAVMSQKDQSSNTRTMTKEIKVRKREAPSKTVTTTDVTTRITRHLRSKSGKTQKEVKEYPGRLSKEEIEKFTIGCDKVEVNVMTRSMKKTVPASSTESAASSRLMSGQSSLMSGEGKNVEVKTRHTKEEKADMTTTTKTFKTTKIQKQQASSESSSKLQKSRKY